MRRILLCLLTIWSAESLCGAEREEGKTCQLGKELLVFKISFLESIEEHFRSSSVSYNNPFAVKMKKFVSFEIVNKKQTVQIVKSFSDEEMSCFLEGLSSAFAATRPIDEKAQVRPVGKAKGSVREL